MTKDEQLSRGKPKKPRSRKCLSCKSWFSPPEHGVTTCSVQCSILYGKSNFTKQKIKEKRKAKQAFRANDKSTLMQDCQKLANKIGKLNGYLQGQITCITCDLDLRTQNQVDGGHGFPTSTYSGIRFYTTQIKPQCVRCNRHNSGMRSEFEEALVLIYGQDKVDWFKSHKGKTRKYTVEYLRRYKNVMGRRLKILVERYELRK